MKTLSLQEVMNSIVAHEIVLPKPVIAPVENELEAFIALDPLLANLSKDYKTARSQRKDLQTMFGKDDPMVDVALDMEDSAWCAMQARYLELRKETETMRQAQALIRSLEEERIEQALQENYEQKHQKAQEIFYLNRMTTIMKEKNKPSYMLELAYIFLFLMDELRLKFTNPTANLRPAFGYAGT